ncbi:MAG: DUF5989 family protein [Myxococcota bacterium]
MADDPKSSADDRADGFEQQAQQAAKATSGPLREFRYFLGRTRNFWLVPVIVAVLLASLVVVVGGTAVAPLIYALF